MNLLLSLVWVASSALGDGPPVPENFPNACPTHTKCGVNEACGCQVPARSAAGGHFYWDVKGFSRGSKVRCTFTGWPVDLWIRADASRLPAGVTMDCGECRSTPLHLVFDAGAMQDDNDVAVIKWYMPPSDMSTRVELVCSVDG